MVIDEYIKTNTENIGFLFYVNEKDNEDIILNNIHKISEKLGLESCYLKDITLRQILVSEDCMKQKDLLKFVINAFTDKNTVLNYKDLIIKAFTVRQHCNFKHLNKYHAKINVKATLKHCNEVIPITAYELKKFLLNEKNLIEYDGDIYTVALKEYFPEIATIDVAEAIENINKALQYYNLSFKNDLIKNLVTIHINEKVKSWMIMELSRGDKKITTYSVQDIVRFCGNKISKNTNIEDLKLYIIKNIYMIKPEYAEKEKNS